MAFSLFVSSHFHVPNITSVLKYFQVITDVYSSFRVNFRSSVSGRFKIESCVHIDFYIILNSFWSRIRFQDQVNTGSSGLFYTSLQLIVIYCVKKYHNRLQLASIMKLRKFDRSINVLLCLTLFTLFKKKNSQVVIQNDVKRLKE